MPEEFKLFAICKSLGLNGTRDGSGISSKSSPLIPSHLTLQAELERENKILRVLLKTEKTIYIN